MYQVKADNEKALYADAVALLKQLIAIPSLSKEEYGTSAAITAFLSSRGVEANRVVNNIWAANKHFDTSKPTLLLNSHHDTVRPNKDYTRHPYLATEQDGRLYGLGSNDAGGCLVSLIAAFLHFYDRTDLKYNLILAATGEEEISGANGLERLLQELGKIDCAIVGEPTCMEMAVAEKGLMVLDCMVYGKSGHAARNEGDNAIYKAMKDIEWFRTFSFPKLSDLLGEVKMSVTLINAGTQHNVVPDRCSFVVDIRVNDQYTHAEVLDIVKQHVGCEVVPRSMRLRSSIIKQSHPLVKAGTKIGLPSFGSSTLSDKALMPFPALKIGPGDSARSHMADEFIYLKDIEEGIAVYIKLLNALL